MSVKNQYTPGSLRKSIFVVLGLVGGPLTLMERPICVSYVPQWVQSCREKGIKKNR